MGNCLEPSQTEIENARAEKARRVSVRARQRGLLYPYPRGLYLPPPEGAYPGPPKAPSVVAVDRRTGQQFIVPYTAATAGMFYDETRRSVYSSRPGSRYEGDSLVESKGKRRRSNENHNEANVEVHANGVGGNKFSKKQRSPIGELFITTGVIDFQEEGDVILDYIDPITPDSGIAPTTITAKDYFEPAKQILEPQNTVTENLTPRPNGNIIIPLDTRIRMQTPEEDSLPPPPPPSPPHPNGDIILRQISDNENVLPPPPSPFQPKKATSQPKVGFADAVIIDDIDGPTKMESHRADSFREKEYEVVDSSNIILDMIRHTPDSTSSPALPVDTMDVVITYSILGMYEHDIVRRLTRQLELSGLTVWAERLGDSSRARKSEKTAQAILGAKVLIVLLSEGSCEQRFIRDHIAIARMANIAIFPVASEPPNDVMDAMPLELKVQLSPYKWTELTSSNEDSFLFQLRSLARSIQDEVEENKDTHPDGMTPKGNLFLRKKSLSNSGRNTSAVGFWDVHFGHRDNIKWERFIQTMKEEYKTSINDTIPEQTQSLLFASLRNRLVDPHSTHKVSNVVFTSDFVSLCQPSDGQDIDLWDAIVQVAGLLQAVKDVLDIESTVRPLVTEYIEHFSSPEMIKVLRDLLSDPDPNLRASAVVSLARCMTSPTPLSVEFVKMVLKDEDYLVREAGCLALGHMKTESAVKELVHAWKNDSVIHVREAAKKSLDQIGGQEVMNAISTDQ